MTAWLGLIAMCLVAFAPTVSHFARAARTVMIPVCTADGEQTARRVSLVAGSMPAMSATAIAIMATRAAIEAAGGVTGPSVAHDMGTLDGMPSTHHGPSAGHAMGGHADHGSQPMDDCGYCDLLNHAPAMAMVPPAPVGALLLLFAVFVLPALRRYTPLGAFPSGRPRAPPAIS
uniref:DUF2946 domain-containing protein n=1 Tax=Bordetella sputigena TaxID=1416810 RepID=UPI0039EF7BB3